MKYLSDYPELLALWHPVKNGNADPKTISHGSNKKYWFKCPVSDDHEWEVTVNCLVNNSKKNNTSGCPCCKGFKVVLSNCLATTHPEIAKQWHPTKNGDLTPYDVTAGSKRKVWWKCSIDEDHEWETVIYSRTNSKRPCNCSCCAGKRIVLSNCFATTHPEAAKLWHPTKNGKLTPYEVFSKSNKKYWFKCLVSEDHEWQAVLASITGRESKFNGCPCCSGNKVVLSNCLATTHPEIAKQWHPIKNGNLTPYGVTAGSHKKVWWKCEKGHEWKSYINNRTNKYLFRGCLVCNESKGEKRVAEYLNKNNLPYKRQYKHKKCKNKQLLPFDFIVRIKDQLGFLIEYQGQQHYELCTFGSKNICPIKILKGIQHRDKIKKEFCEKNNIPLLVIPYWEFDKIELLIDDFILNLKKAS